MASRCYVCLMCFPLVGILRFAPPSLTTGRKKLWCRPRVCCREVLCPMALPSRVERCLRFGELIAASILLTRFQGFATCVFGRRGERKLEKWVVQKIRKKKFREQDRGAPPLTVSEEAALLQSQTRRPPPPLPGCCDGTAASNWMTKRTGGGPPSPPPVDLTKEAAPYHRIMDCATSRRSGHMEVGVATENMEVEVGARDNIHHLQGSRRNMMLSGERRPSSGGAAAVVGGNSDVRLDKVCALQGLCSRHEARRYIDMGLVTVNGQVTRGNPLLPWHRPLAGEASPPLFVCAGDRAQGRCMVKVELENRAVQIQEQKKTILLNKPLNYLSCPSHNSRVSLPLCLSLLIPSRSACDCRVDPSKSKHLSPAGRLDADSTGLIVYTQDGRLCSLLCGSSSTLHSDSQQIDKEYQVKVDGQVSEDSLALLRQGLSLDGVELLHAEVDRVPHEESGSSVWLRFVLREGRNRQIRRMCALVGLHVLRIHRVRIGAVSLLDLPMGHWRLLKPGESF
eukprot:GHVS01074485.1.p1 GENE.GHVS01074485.1~~GHVS01074485.1.p1  ORF type:complete len:509 (-),score=54.13 GHVS01074485.1:54-1580(-)